MTTPALTTPALTTPPATPPSNPTPGALTPGPGTSPPVTPGVGTPPGSASPAPTPPATTTPDGTITPLARVVPEADAYVLPPEAPAALRQWAKTNDFTQAQLDTTLAQFQTAVADMKTAEMTALQTQGNAHVESWGEAKTENLGLAKAALLQMDPEGKLKGMLKETGYANHPVVLEFLKDLGRNLREGGFLTTPVSLSTGGKPVTAAQSMFGKNHPSKQ